MYINSSSVILYCMCVLAAMPGRAQQLSFTTAAQQESFHWSIAGNSSGQNPNIYSELKWRQLRGPAAGLRLEWPVWRWLSAYAEGHHMIVSSGKVSDTDYGEDDRQDPVYKGVFDSDKGSSSSWALGLGGVVLNRGEWKLQTWLGYGLSYQDLHIVDHSGIYADLNSSYASRWQGPMLQLEADWHSGRRWGLYAGLDYHQVGYRAKADWNLITSFMHPVSFRHRADGYGASGQVGVSYAISRTISCRLGGGWEHWATGAGSDELYLVTGGSETTRMNGAYRNAGCVELGVQWKIRRLFPGL